MKHAKSKLKDRKFKLKEECTAEIYDASGEFSLGVVYGFERDKIEDVWSFDDDNEQWIKVKPDLRTWYFDETLSVCLKPIGEGQFRVEPDYAPFLEWIDYENTLPVMDKKDAETKVEAVLAHFDLGGEHG